MAATRAPAASGTAARAGSAQSAQSVLRRLDWQLQHAVNTTLTGNYRSAFRGRGMEFDQVVKYQWGDDLRDIDWNVTARLGEPFRKKFIEERELSIIVVFEDSPALQFGSGERSRRQTLLEVAALLMLLASINRDRIGLFYCSPEQVWSQRPVAGRKGIVRASTRLMHQAPPALDLDPACLVPWRSIRRAAAKGSVVVWFGPFADTDAPEGWRVLQQRCQTVGVRADDPWDAGLPQGLQISAYDPMSGRLLNLDTASRADQRGHAHWRQWREATFTRLFPRSGDRLIVRNDEDPLQALVGFFQRLGQLAGGR